MPVPKARLNWTATQALCPAGSMISASTVRPIIPNSPKARIRVVEFSNVRHVMQRCAPSRPRGGAYRLGHRLVKWTIRITVDGNQDSEVISVLREAVAGTRAV